MGFGAAGVPSLDRDTGDEGAERSDRGGEGQQRDEHSARPGAATALGDGRERAVDGGGCGGRAVRAGEHALRIRAVARSHRGHCSSFRNQARVEGVPPSILRAACAPHQCRPSSSTARRLS